MNIIDLLAEMMSFRPITSDMTAVNGLVTFLSDYLIAGGVPVCGHVLEGRRLLYAGAKTTPDILCNAHLDVVPADDAMFTLTQENGWLKGRGTHDCLGNCAMLANLLIKYPGDPRLGVIFSTDEEVGGQTTKHAVQQGYAARDMILVVDGSGNSVVVAQKGVLVVRLIAQGEACHSATPWEGVNAIDRLVDGYIKIRDLFPVVTPGNEWFPTLSATVINGGSVHNRVPDQAEMTLNIRLTDANDPETVKRQLAEGSGLLVEPVMESPVVHCDPEAPSIQRLITHMGETLHVPIAIKHSNGATDARHFIDLDVPIAIIGIPGKDSHGAEEALAAEALPAYETMLENFIFPPVA